MGQCPGEGEELTLASGEITAPLAHERVAPAQPTDEAFGVHVTGSRFGRLA